MLRESRKQRMATLLFFHFQSDVHIHRYLQTSVQFIDAKRTSVLLIVGPKCTLAASDTALLVNHGEYADGRDK